jgi:glycosyltransferase involved in cell wall biosynthesis
LTQSTPAGHPSEIRPGSDTSKDQDEHSGEVRDSFTSIPVTTLELADDTPVPRPNGGGEIHLLVTLHGLPVGTCWELPPADSPQTLRRSLIEKFAEPVYAHLRADDLTVTELLRQPGRTVERCCHSIPRSEALVSVVIATLGREPRLLQAVESVLAQTHTNLELLVVDNDPGRQSVASMLETLDDPRLIVIDEPRRGTSHARNAGLHAARGGVLAFIDDDVDADPQWLQTLVAPFRTDTAVNCVTGLVLPAELNTQAQIWFEQYGAFDKGFTRTVWNLSGAPVADGQPGPRDALFPYSAGVYGSGNNMAFRRQVLTQLGGFDPALGGGARTRGGEDLDLFLRVVLSGATLVYEPLAVVRHHARRDVADLERQLFGYGSGMCALVVKQLVAGPRSAFQMLRRIPTGVRRLLDPRSPKNARKTSNYPRRLMLIELTGYAAGPWLYLRSRGRRS